jgi:cell division transport system ATP-binding protein
VVNVIKFDNVQLFYKKHRALEHADFEIQGGELVLLVGPSGAGKSTLIKLLHKELEPTSGEIQLFGKPMKKIKRTTLRRNVGVVFQDYESSLLARKTAFGNISYVLQAQGQSPKQAKEKTLEALGKLDVLEKAKHYPYQLSGGEKQRVAIARAIANNPSLLLCDEPTGNLDPENSKIVMDYIKELNRAGTTIIMATHDQWIIAANKDRRQFLVENGSVKEHTKNTLVR